MSEKHKPDDIAGGQAVIEGIMMRHGSRIALAVRKPDKSIHVEERDYVPLSKRYRALGLMFVRGTVSLFEMMVIGVKYLLHSAELALPESEGKIKPWEVAGSLAISMGAAFLLFIVIPAYCFAQLRSYVPNTLVLNLVEGCIRMGIFLSFLSTTLLMKDMRRIYMYHGAEHKTIFTWENGQELSVENIRNFSTRHPRCGTSFMLVVMIISILVFSLLGRPDFVQRVIYKLLLVPVVAGISYEVIRYTGKHRDWAWVHALSWPGLLLQRITTREPDDDQIEVAIAAMNKVI